MPFTKADVSIIGLGKVGSSTLAAMASRGIKAIGVDVLETSVAALERGKAPVEETDLQATLTAHSANYRVTTDYEDAVRNSDISIVLVPTPSDERGAFSIQYAARAFSSIGKALRGKTGYHLVVLASTVLPGATRQGLLPMLEKESGKICGIDFGLCYNPKLIALGSVIHDVLNPDLSILGEFDARSGDIMEGLLKRFFLNNAPIKRMSIENAELAKVAIACFVTFKISYANMLASFCEHLPNADVDTISDAIGADSRIGRKCLTGGLGFGGPCFPRDTVALSFMGKELHVDTSIVEACTTFNNIHSASLLSRLTGKIPESGTAAVLGLSYKPFSHVTEDSIAIALCRALQKNGYEVGGYDPLAGPSAKQELGHGYTVHDTLEDCLRNAEIVFIATDDPQFRALTPDHFPRRDGKTYVIDFWRCLNPAIAEAPAIEYLPAGRSIGGNDEELLAKLWQI
ncbi:MAG: UDP-glucose 6-dehydrogenase TuaD [Desulfovibrio sp.]